MGILYRLAPLASVALATDPTIDGLDLPELVVPELQLPELVLPDFQLDPGEEYDQILKSEPQREEQQVEEAQSQEQQFVPPQVDPQHSSGLPKIGEDSVMQAPPAGAVGGQSDSAPQFDALRSGLYDPPPQFGNERHIPPPPPTEYEIPPEDPPPRANIQEEKTSQSENMRACSANPECSHLAGNCCPTDEGLALDCCNGIPAPEWSQENQQAGQENPALQFVQSREANHFLEGLPSYGGGSPLPPTYAAPEVQLPPAQPVQFLDSPPPLSTEYAVYEQPHYEQPVYVQTPYVDPQPEQLHHQQPHQQPYVQASYVQTAYTDPSHQQPYVQQPYADNQPQNELHEAFQQRQQQQFEQQYQQQQQQQFQQQQYAQPPYPDQPQNELHEAFQQRQQQQLLQQQQQQFEQHPMPEQVHYDQTNVLGVRVKAVPKPASTVGRSNGLSQLNAPNDQLMAKWR